MATAIAHVCSSFTISCDKRNSSFNHSPFSFLPSNFVSFKPLSFSANLSHGVSFRGVDTFCRPKSVSVVCMAQRYASGTIKRKRMGRKRGGDPDKKKHRKRKGSRKKKPFKIIKLASTTGTGFVYTKKKSSKMDKLELKKYDPKVKRHVMFTEVK